MTIHIHNVDNVGRTLCGRSTERVHIEDDSKPPKLPSCKLCLRAEKARG